METTAQRIKRIVADTLNVRRHFLCYNTHLKNDLGADSLDILEVITLLEKEFGVSVPDERVEKIRTVGDIINCFEEIKFAPLIVKKARPFRI